MRRYKITLMGLTIAVFIVVYAHFVDLDPFDWLVTFFKSVEDYEVDEIFIGAFIFIICLAIDLLRLQREQKVEHEKNKVYKAMIASSHHILNNFLNQMQLFKITAESTPGFDQEILAMYDTIMKEASDQIKKLSDISEVSETSIKEAVMPKSEG
jgi:hypothetical protein